MDQILKTIIIDDEPPARQRLKELLAHHPTTFQLIGEAENGRKGLEMIKRLDPDLIFLDIQMPGMTGFELLEQLDKVPIIIFCTAYDQYSLDAFETNSIDYLLKPVKAERLAKTVEKIKRFSRPAGKSASQNEILEFLRQLNMQVKQPEMTSITIKTGNKLSFVKLDDIAFFRAEEKYVKITTVRGEEKITEKSLKELAEKLPSSFLRIHRSIIVNKNLIEGVQHYFNSKYVFVMKDIHKTKLYSGRTYQAGIKGWLD